MKSFMIFSPREILLIKNEDKWRGVWHVCGRRELQKGYLAGKPKRWRQFGSHRHRCKDNSKWI
jgi:hypothetical protein